MRETPHWLYERLPYLYVLGGAFAVSGFELSLVRIGGLILILAGLRIFRLRIRSRLKSVPQILFRLGALR